MCKVSFLVVNWNGKSFLSQCIDSLVAQSHKDFEIIFVDNGSSDGSIEFVKKNYPTVKVVALDINSGFTGGNNTGLRYATGQYIALVNNDAILAHDWLENMIAVLDWA